MSSNIEEFICLKVRRTSWTTSPKHFVINNRFESLRLLTLGSPFITLVGCGKVLLVIGSWLPVKCSVLCSHWEKFPVPLGPCGPGSPCEPFIPCGPITPWMPCVPLNPRGPPGPMGPWDPLKPRCPTGPWSLLTFSNWKIHRCLLIFKSIFWWHTCVLSYFK